MYGVKMYLVMCFILSLSTMYCAGRTVETPI